MLSLVPDGRDTRFKPSFFPKHLAALLLALNNFGFVNLLDLAKEVLVLVLGFVLI